MEHLALWEFKVKYPDIGDDVSDCTGEGLDNMYKNSITTSRRQNKSTGIKAPDFGLKPTTQTPPAVFGRPYHRYGGLYFELENQSATVGFTSATENPEGNG